MNRNVTPEEQVVLETARAACIELIVQALLTESAELPTPFFLNSDTAHFVAEIAVDEVFTFLAA